MRYTWTDEKYRENLRQHRIAFEDAVQIFERATVERVDDRFDYGEIRVYAHRPGERFGNHGDLYRQRP